MVTARLVNLCVNSLVCVTPGSLYCRAWGGVKKDKKGKLKDWTCTLMEDCVSFRTFFWFCPPTPCVWLEFYQIRADHFNSRGASRLWAHLTPFAFSDQLSLAETFELLWRILLTLTISTDQFSAFKKTEKKSLVISGFFVPFYRALFNPTLIHVMSSLCSNSQFIYWPADGGWVKNSSFLVFLHTAWIHLRTYAHRYTCIYLCAHTHS